MAVGGWPLQGQLECLQDLQKLFMCRGVGSLLKENPNLDKVDVDHAGEWVNVDKLWCI